jgi:2-polyprenyl-3-methyl-5-hydroxy-6-metoxy-1,4-benzoquinol methylase
MPEQSFPDAEARANLSRGISNEDIYRMVQRAVNQRRSQRGGAIIDVGCGAGGLWQFLSKEFSTYIGVDAVKYDGFPEGGQFWKAEFNTEPINLPDGSADVVACVETIEHVENPRALARELVRLAKPGGWVIVTTPNQLAFSSLACLLLKRNFQHFQEGGEGGYPTHISALLEIDLIRIARENSLTDIAIDYTNHGRIPFTGMNWPAIWPFHGRRFSDNIMVVARKPESPARR